MDNDEDLIYPLRGYGHTLLARAEHALAAALPNLQAVRLVLARTGPDVREVQVADAAHGQPETTLKAAIREVLTPIHPDAYTAFIGDGAEGYTLGLDLYPAQPKPLDVPAPVDPWDFSRTDFNAGVDVDLGRQSIAVLMNHGLDEKQHLNLRRAGYRTLASIEAATNAEIRKIPGIGPVASKQLAAALDRVYALPTTA